VQVTKCYCPQINAAMLIVTGGCDLERTHRALNTIHALSVRSVGVEWQPQITFGAHPI
jgi:hypothetical protein